MKNTLTHKFNYEKIIFDNKNNLKGSFEHSKDSQKTLGHSEDTWALGCTSTLRALGHLNNFFFLLILFTLALQQLHINNTVV